MAKLKLAYPTLRQPPAVTLGRGSLRAAVEALSPGDAVFLSSQPAVRAAWEAACAKRGLRAEAVAVCVKQAGEPTVASVLSGAAFLAQRRPVRLVALGGGSVLDGARLAWLAAAGLLPDVLPDATAVVPRPEFWLIPTTPASGAEGATVAVYARQGHKVPVVHQQLLADHVVLDAQFLDSLDEARLARALCDTLSHAVEAFCSLVPNHLAKELAVTALGLVLRNFGTTDHQRLERLLEAGYLAGLAASHCSVGVVHAWAHSLSGHGFAHAEANALGLLAGLRANRAAPALAALAARQGCADAAELATRLAPVVRAALPACNQARLCELSAQPAWRAQLVAQIAADACLRTNPLSLDAAALGQMVVEAVSRPEQP